MSRGEPECYSKRDARPTGRTSDRAHWCTPESKIRQGAARGNGRIKSRVSENAKTRWPAVTSSSSQLLVCPPSISNSYATDSCRQRGRGRALCLSVVEVGGLSVQPNLKCSLRRSSRRLSAVSDCATVTYPKCSSEALRFRFQPEPVRGTAHRPQNSIHRENALTDVALNHIAGTPMRVHKVCPWVGRNKTISRDGKGVQ